MLAETFKLYLALLRTFEEISCTIEEQKSSRATTQELEHAKLLLSLFVFQRFPNALGSCWVFIDIYTDRVKNSITYGECNDVHRNLSNSFNSKRMNRLERLNKDRFQHGH